MAQIPRTFKYEPREAPPRSFGSIEPKADYKADALLAASEAIEGLGLGDSKEWYRRLGKGAEFSAVGPALDAGSAVANWLDGGDNPGLPLAEALSGAMFVGPMARSGAKPMLDFYNAQRLADRGALMQEVYGATGWLRGPDNKWRRQISDDAMQVDLDPVFEAAGRGEPGRMGDAISHPELFAAYPQLSELNLGLTTIPGALGANIPGQGVMLDRATALVSPSDSLRPVLGHELQHAVQDIEKFAPGGNPNAISQIAQEAGFSPSPDDAMALYRRLFGEIEARDTQFHIANPGLRDALFPYESQVGNTPLMAGDWALPRVPPREIITTQSDLFRMLEALRGNQ